MNWVKNNWKEELNSFYKRDQFWERPKERERTEQLLQAQSAAWDIRKNRVLKELRHFFLENYIILWDISNFLLFDSFQSRQRFSWIKNYQEFGFRRVYIGASGGARESGGREGSIF